MSLYSMSFTSAILILAIVIVRALLLHKLPKQTFLLLWGVALCRLLIPFAVSSRFSVYSALNTLYVKSTEVDIPLLEMSAFKTYGLIPGYSSGDTVMNITETATALQEAAHQAISPFLIIWVVGMVACLLFFFVTHLLCRREYKTALPTENFYVNLWQQEYQVRRKIQVRQLDGIAAPLTYGVLKPIILLPKVADWADETRLRYILTHEFVHIKRFDTLKKVLMAAAVSVHWFNPLVWVMYVLFNRDIEMSCDETVVRLLGEKVKSAYAMTLIELEEKKNYLNPLVSNFSQTAIEQRIVSIMKMKKTSFLSVVLAFFLVIGTTTVFATNAVFPSFDQPDSLWTDNMKLGNMVGLEWITDYSAEEINGYLNFVPQHVESFSNGYYFKEAFFIQSEILDIESDELQGYDEGISFYYTNDDYYYGTTMSLHTGFLALPPPYEYFPQTAVNTDEMRYGNIPMTYSQIVHKEVPMNYVPTKEEEEQIAQGLLAIHISDDDKVVFRDYQWVDWDQNGVHYNLMYVSMDEGYRVDKSDLLEMVKEVIGSARE